MEVNSFQLPTIVTKSFILDVGKGFLFEQKAILFNSKAIHDGSSPLQ